MITVLYDTPVNLQDCNLPDIPNFRAVCFSNFTVLYGLKGGRHNVFKTAKLPTNWLKIPESVIVSDFLLSSFGYLMYLAETCCDSKDVFLVNGRSWSRSCHFAVGVVGVIGTFSLP